MKKFDFAIGNPPYQEPKEGTSDNPVYNVFIDAAYEIADKVEMISPARFLSNAGKTPKVWNEKMLADEHLKVLYYEQDSSKVFSNTDIKGGIVVTYRDKNKSFGAIEVFSSFDELRSIKAKVFGDGGAVKSISDIMILQNRFALDVLLKDHPEYVADPDPKKKLISSDGTEKRIVSSAFDKLSVFQDEGGKSTYKILGIVEKNKRVYKYINRKYVQDNGNLQKYKVLVPKTNGVGVLGEVLSSPLIETPLTGYTQSFIGVGKFDKREEAEACLKYIKSKFARALLGILKITQDNPPEKWKYVPLQDFTATSDINWVCSISEIDRQLYQKYNLSEDEIRFVESHIKEMD